MASPLAWRDNWLLGIEHLDADHREIVRLHNRLVEASQDAPFHARHTGDENADGVLDSLKALIDHLRRHFAVEEAFLEAIRYPESASHRREHALQLAELVDLHRRLTITKDPRIDAECLESIKDWFFDHIIDEDRDFARYYCEQIKEEAGHHPFHGRRSQPPATDPRTTTHSDASWHYAGTPHSVTSGPRRVLPRGPSR